MVRRSRASSSWLEVDRDRQGHHRQGGYRRDLTAYMKEQRCFEQLVRGTRSIYRCACAKAREKHQKRQHVKETHTFNIQSNLYSASPNYQQYLKSEMRLYMPLFDAMLTNIVCLLSSRVGNSRVLPLAPSPGGNQLLSCLVPRNRFLHLPSRTHCSALLRLVFPGEATTWALEYGVQQFVAILY